MQTVLEQRAFEHGLRIMLKLMEGCADAAMADGKPGHANYLYGIVDCAENDIPEITTMYAESGYETLMRQVSQACIVPEK